MGQRKDARTVEKQKKEAGRSRRVAFPAPVPMNEERREQSRSESELPIGSSSTFDRNLDTLKSLYHREKRRKKKGI